MMGGSVRNRGNFSIYSGSMKRFRCHPVREIAAVLDLSWVHAELAPFYPKIGRPSIDPGLMIRMLILD